ncbi:MAG: hypothetical protein BGP01_13435 [Paludibacter sp. 47-17]|nr:MAG: hypothetical protein BGP01_13435 [Paludibacter sp. 47-17]
MEFFIIDAANQQLLPAFDAVRLAAELSKLTGREVNAYRLPFSSVRFNRELDSLFFEVDGTAYTCRLSDYLFHHKGTLNFLLIFSKQSSPII